MSRAHILLPITVTATLLALAAFSPALAGAATSYTIRGAGFGHGVGLSQYGAQGMAKDGKRHRAILVHYYRGTRLGAAPTDGVRVLLGQGDSEVVFSGAARIPGRRALDPARTYRATATPGGEVELCSASGRGCRRFPGPLVVDGRGKPVRLAGAALNGISDGEYRGALVVHPDSGGLTAVNHVRLEDYLRGVVPSEMPASWHREALRAQSVAARSYALATARNERLFDQYPDMRSQVYKGVSGEDDRTDAAVAATAGKVLLHEGKVATAFFFSSSGGRTEANENVFGGRPLPYLRSVADPADRISPHHRWTLTLTREQIEDKLGSLVDGHYRGIRVINRGDSPRVRRAEVVGTGGLQATSGATLRSRLGLRDTWAYFGRIETAAAGAGVAARSPAAGRAPAGVLTGKVVPAPRDGRIRIEARGRRGWKTIERAHTDRGGVYRVSVDRDGRYRVRADGAHGPAVRVR
jgi:stage II sporulation protein D